MNYLILTHGGCMDGVCAAMVAGLWARQQPCATGVEIVQCDYGVPFDVERARGKYVIVTDFALRPDEMEAIRKASSSFAWFDHHESNAKLAAAFASGGDAARDWVVFDLKKSGAGIAWDSLFPNERRPWLIDYVEDRDLWRFALPNSRAVSFYVQSHAKEAAAYEAMLDVPLEYALAQGLAMSAYVAGWVRDVVATARIADFQGHQIALVTCTYNGISDVLEILARDVSPSGIAIAWLQRKDGMFQYSVRTTERHDASAIAKRFGGGGHLRAAGFQSAVLFPWCDNVRSEASF